MRPLARVRRHSLAIGTTAAVIGGALLAGCGGGSPTVTPGTAPHRGGTKPLATVPGPAGLVAGGQPQPNGSMWVLARTNGVANIQELNLVTGHVSEIVPVSSSANSLSESSSGIVGVGIGTSNAGALDLRNGTSGALIATVPVGAPVRDVFAGADGSTFYVLNGNASSSSVTLVNATSHQPSVSVPVPLDTIAIAVDPSGTNLFALRAAGIVDQITIGTGQVAGAFAVGNHPVELSVAPQGGTIYVLKRAGPGIMNVGVLAVNTERQLQVLPAPTNAVGIQLGLDGRSIYDLVGTSSYGNIQVFPLPGS